MYFLVANGFLKQRKVCNNFFPAFYVCSSHYAILKFYISHDLPFFPLFFWDGPPFESSPSYRLPVPPTS